MIKDAFNTDFNEEDEDFIPTGWGTPKSNEELNRHYADIMAEVQSENEEIALIEQSEDYLNYNYNEIQEQDEVDYRFVDEDTLEQD